MDVDPNGDADGECEAETETEANSNEDIIMEGGTLSPAAAPVVPIPGKCGVGGWLLGGLYVTISRAWCEIVGRVLFECVACAPGGSGLITGYA